VVGFIVTRQRSLDDFNVGMPQLVNTKIVKAEAGYSVVASTRLRARSVLSSYGRLCRRYDTRKNVLHWVTHVYL
jgi:hypothetical protein